MQQTSHFREEIAISITSNRNCSVSWQQAARLRDEQEHDGYLNIWTLFGVTDDITEAYLRSRLAQLVRHQDVLRIVDASADGDGWATYVDDVESPVGHHRCVSYEESRRLAQTLASQPLARGNRPLWNVSLLEHPGVDGQPTRSVLGVFDHLVSDGRSLHLFQRAVQDVGYRPHQVRGDYRRWVSRQYQDFPRHRDAASTPASEFWRRHLDGTPPERVTPLPFLRTEQIQPRGQLQAMARHVPISAVVLQKAAGRFGATPFLLVLASMASVVAALGEVNDVTLRVITSGRPVEFLDTFGWFADSLPVRLRDRCLEDPRRAVRVAQSAWLDILEFQETPWDYIRNVCSPATERCFTQLVLNFIPYEIGGIFADDSLRTLDGSIDGLHVSFARRGNTGHRIGTTYNPDHYDATDIRAFLDLVVAQLIGLLGDHRAMGERTAVC